LIEFHLTFNDLTADISKLKPIKGIEKIVVHAPELFGQDHILDLATDDLEYLNQSIQYLKDVVRVTENIKELMQYSAPIEIVVNVGGFSETDFIAVGLRKSLYDKVAQNLSRVETDAVEFIVQTMPPYPWHFGGQRHHNLFVNAEEIVDFCEQHKRRICFDISHSAMAATYEGRPLLDYVSALGKYSTHLHISDDLGLDGEGLQIGEGEIEFGGLVNALKKFAPQASFIPEIWQGHKDAGQPFYEALERLEKYAL
jgi:N-acetylneuraminate synthase